MAGMWLLSVLQEYGFHHKGFADNISNVNYLFVRDITDCKTEEELLQSFTHRARKAVKKAEKNGVFIKQITTETLDDFYIIVSNASEEKGFSARNKSFYESILNDIGHPHAQIHVAYIDIGMYREQLTKQHESAKKELLAKEDTFTENQTKSNEKKVATQQEQVSSIEAAQKLLENMPKTGVIPLAGIYFYCFGKEVISALGGSDERYTYFNGMIALYWHMFKYALENDYEKYNFYGTYGFNNPNSPRRHVYTFKKNFGGYVVQLVGEFSLRLSPIKATTYSVLQKINRLR